MFIHSESYARFCKLLTLAEEVFAAGNFLAAVRLAQMAARYAFPGNVGLFGSPRLERLLLDIGKEIPVASVCGVQHHDENMRKVLHILSYGRPVGGDSRFVWRWIQEDRNNQHFVAITSQDEIEGDHEFPEILRRSTENSGGFLWMPNASTSNPLEQARELRVLCQEMDIVVLHLFPYDIVPLLALAVGCDSIKTIFVNHSDHTFWIGASVAHFVVHLRRQSPLFLRNRRGLNSEKFSILPIPLHFSPSSVTRVQAKRELGYESDIVLLLTIAAPFKYSSPGQIGFLDLVVPVISENPQTVLLAVGPDPEGSWLSASILTEGRIVPLGTQYDNDLLYAAADVYLDSVPFSSITSVLEAGALGVPLIGYFPNPELELLGAGAPGLDNAMELANDMKSYQALLTRLIRDEEFRRRSGERVQSQILSLHTGDNWLNALHDLYVRVESINVRGCLMEDNDSFESSRLNLALVQLYRRSWNIGQLIRNFIGILPYRDRFSITWHLYLMGFDLTISNLLPPPFYAATLGIARRMKSLIRQIRQSR
ncbi:hypothetical protein [Methylomicrobium lacus]|uniref:hypothetical protein n=1 Tax=Methylomicrobium lacus TaxID=136992 RepID=UPI0035A87174